MPDETGLVRLDINDIKPGDEIYIATPVKFGNTPFRYPSYVKETVVRITPKKTKLITDRNDWTVMHARFYAESPELIRRNTVTGYMITALNRINNISYYRYSARKLSDDDMIQFAKHICDAADILKTVTKE